MRENREIQLPLTLLWPDLQLSEELRIIPRTVPTRPRAARA